MRMWYVIQVERGREEAMAELIGRAVPASMLEECFYPGERPVPLAAEEVELIGGFTHPGERVVPMSRAVKQGEKVVIVDGPLLGREGLIKEVNRHKSTATLELDLCGRTVATRVGLAVLAEPDAVSSRAARLRTKAVCN